jgi:tetratricopeptide (TPR) repeat protein
MQEAPTRGEALEQAGFAAAAWMLGQARSVPPWLQFSSESEAAKAFREYQESKSATEQTAITALTSAVRRDPTSGAALVQLGYAYDLDGQSINALECYERAVAMFPDYRIAQYRAAIGWSALYVAGGIDEQTRQRLESLTHIGRRTSGQGTASAPVSGHRQHGSASDAWQCFVLDMARRRFRNAGDHSPVWWLSDLSVRLLSVYERPVLPRLGQRWSIHLAVRAACLPTRARQQASHGSSRGSGSADDWRLRRLDWWARRRKAHWQLRYNLACTHSARYCLGQGDKQRERTRAVDLLRDALLHPDAQDLTREWLRKDPDLRPLEHDPRFAALLNWAATSEEEQP